MRHLKQLGNRVSIPIPRDENGYLGRKCPDCERYFKITPGTGLAGENLPCHCPYCGHSAQQDQFFTKAQIEFAKSVAINKVTGAFIKDLKRLEFNHRPRGPFGIGISMKVEGRLKPIRRYSELQLEPVEKKHIVRLTKGQQQSAQFVVDKLDGSPQKVKRAQILLKADQRAGGWTDEEISEAFSCAVNTVENVRKRFCELGFQVALDGKKRANPPRERKFDGEAEAAVIATRLSEPPEGYANWTLELLQERVVALSIVASVSKETVRKTLKKMK